MSRADLRRELRRVLREMDTLAATLCERPTIYLVGAATLVLAGITRRATQDLDYIADRHRDLFMNVITESGVHSHNVPAGLVCMPEGWRDRATPLAGHPGHHARFMVPSLADRTIDKLARGSAADFSDLEAVVRSSLCPDPGTLHRLAAAVLAAPVSSVFDPETFRSNYGRLAALMLEKGVDLPPLEPAGDTAGD